jgi:glycosyltransferase involved in cell wall biosynthesis
MLTGGYRAVFECGSRLIEKGHNVNYIYPLLPLRINPNFSLKGVLSNFLPNIKIVIKNIIAGNSVDWFKVRGKLIRLFSISPRFIRFFESKIPDSDVIVATAWETAYVVNQLSKGKGVKCYFVQHYEIWDLWNSNECWNEVEKVGDSYTMCLAMADVVPDQNEIRRNKEIVDKTYTLTLKKITTASWLGELLEKKFGEKAVGLIPIGNNFEIFSVKSFQKKKSNDKKKVLLSYRGKPWKGDFDGLKAMQIVKEKIPNIEILMYGQDKNYNPPDWIQFQRYPSDEELKELYCSADVFVFPSWVEGWGSPPMEAMACGTACVTTDVGGVPDYAIAGVTALVVPPREPNKIAEAVITLLKDDDKRNQIAKAGYDYIQQFTWDRTVDQFERILQEICTN